MVINKINITSFAGLNNFHANLMQGINVIVGPNESGKTTIFNAIKTCLLVPAKLTNTQQQKIAKFFPVNSGNTIEVSINIKNGTEDIELTRKWGSNPMEYIVFNNGNKIEGKDAVEDFLINVLPANKGTMNYVLLTYQSGLQNFLKNYAENKNGDINNTLSELGNILRNSLLQTDNVSVDIFKQNLNKMYNEYYEKWDIEKQIPETTQKNTRYQKGLGSIATAFYKLEDIKIMLDNAMQIENDYEKAVKELSEVLSEYNEKKEFINKYEPLIEKYRQNQIHKTELENVNSTIEKLDNVSVDWIEKETQIKQIQKSEIPRLEKELEKLRIKEKKAREYAKLRELKKLYDNATEKQKDYLSKKELLENATDIDKKELEHAKKCMTNIKSNERFLSVGNINVSFEAKEKTGITFKQGDETIQSIEMNAGDKKDFKDISKINIQSKGFVFNASSSKIDFDKINAEIVKSKNELNAFYKKYKVDNVEQGEEKFSEYQQRQSDCNYAKKGFDEIRGEYDLKELKQRLRDFESKATDSVEEIIKELSSYENELKNKMNEAEKLQVIINGYVAEYDTKQGVITKRNDKEFKKQDLIQKIKSNETKDTENIEQIKNTFENNNKRIKQLEIRRLELEKNKSALEAKLPEESSEQIQEELKYAKKEFENVIRRGKAVLKVKTVADKLITDFDQSTYSGIQERVKHYVSVITNKRYNDISIEKSVPSGLVNQTGNTLDLPRLSEGTKDALALATHLSMAEYFLKQAGGIFVIDDPLVNMDEKRIEFAVEAIKEFARKNQTLIFTCNEKTAALFEGNEIKLEKRL